MKKFLAEDKKIVSGRARRKVFAAPIDSPDEELRRLLRRAVKSVPVPADLESKILRNLLRKQL